MIPPLCEREPSLTWKPAVEDKGFVTDCSENCDLTQVFVADNSPISGWKYSLLI